MPTIKDVAAHAGVAPSIVSRLLNGDPTLRLRPETRVRIETAVRTLDYTPNRAARALRGSRAGALGVALPGLLTSPPYEQILNGAEAEARRCDYLLVTVEVDALAADPAAFRRFVRSGATDGLLLQRDGLPADEIVMKNLHSTELPFVIVNERVSAPLASVALDDRGASALATSHLLALGHTDIAHLAVGGSTSRSLDRLKGWEQALINAGRAAPADLVEVGGSEPQTGYAGMMTLLANRKRPTAVVVGTLMSAIGALAALRAAGLRVPEDMSLIAHHDAWPAQYSSPPLTAVSLPLEDLGRHAVRLLIEQLDGAEPRQELLVCPKPVIVPRESTCPPQAT